VAKNERANHPGDVSMRELIYAVIADRSGLAEFERWLLRAMVVVLLLGVIVGFGAGMGGMTGAMADFFVSR
jgi:hypothetical protein